MVVVLIPPAVEPGLPPMNMSTIVKSLLSGVSAAVSTVLKPAVLAVTEPNNDANMAPGVSMPAMVLFFSKIYKNSPPPKTSISVVDITILAWSEYLLSLNFLVLTSFHMVKPIPPMMISSIIVILTNGSAAYFVNDEYSSFMPIKSKPALQNADIEWNTEKYMPLNMPKSGMKRIAKSTAPMPSIRKVPLIIMLKSLTIPPISSALTLSCIRSLCLSPIFLCRSMENATPIEIKPMPPI